LLVLPIQKGGKKERRGTLNVTAIISTAISMSSLGSAREKKKRRKLWLAAVRTRKKGKKKREQEIYQAVKGSALHGDIATIEEESEGRGK